MSNIILDQNNQPFQSFGAASMMRDQLNKTVPGTNFVVIEIEGGFAIEARKSSHEATPGPAAHQKPRGQLSQETQRFMQTTPIVLRPALRVHWFNLLMGFIIMILAFQVNGFVKSFVPADWYFKVLNTLPQMPLILFAIVFLTGLFQILFVFLQVYSYAYTIDQDGVTSRFGIISRDSHSIKYQDIRGVSLEQSWFERMLRVGSLEFYTAGTGGADVVFTNILHAEKIRKRLDEYAAYCRR